MRQVENEQGDVRLSLVLGILRAARLRTKDLPKIVRDAVIADYAA